MKTCARGRPADNISKIVHNPRGPNLPEIFLAFLVSKQCVAPKGWSEIMENRMSLRSIRSSLLTGAAIASLSTVAIADGWNSFIVFGDRTLDTGQYVSQDSVFLAPGEEIEGDGRLRNTNSVTGEGAGQPYSQLVSDALGFGVLNPSQPQTLDGIPTPESGFNYAATFYRSQDVLSSIVGTARTGSIRYRQGDDVRVTPGTSRPGLLNDPDRAANAWGALVLINGGVRDLRETADIDLTLQREVDLDNTEIVTNSGLRTSRATAAADNIAAGAAALSNAGAGLVVVTNALDVGAIPETPGDVGLVAQADAALVARETEAANAEAVANNAEMIASASASIAATAAVDAAAANQRVSDAQADPATTPALLAALRDIAATADNVAVDSEALATAQAATARERRLEADQVALTAHEVALRPQLDAAIADPTLIPTIRTAATDTFNARLTQNLQSIDGNIVLVDQRALFDRVIAEPEFFGLSAEFDQAVDCQSSNVLYPCNSVGAQTSEILFSNGIDLTTTGHQLAADQITALVSAPAALGGIAQVGISAARGISDAGRDQLSTEQTWTPGLAPWASGVASRVKLSDSNSGVQQEAGFFSGVAGLRYTFGSGFAVGGGLGYQKVTSPGEKSAVEYDGSGYFGTVFAGINSGPIFASATGTYGKVDFGGLDRVSQIGAARIINSADEDATVTGFTAEAGVRLVEYKVLRAGPIANFSHWSSEIDGYTENGWAATAVSVGDLEAKSTRAGLGAFLEAGKLVEGKGSVFRAKILYGYEFQDQTQTITVTPLGGNSVGSFSGLARGADKAPLEFGAEVVFGAGRVTTTLGYDGLFGDVSDHRFRIGASMPL